MNAPIDLFHALIGEIDEYAILLIDEKGDILNCNKGVEKITGYTEGDLLSKNIRLLFANSERNKGIPEQVHQQAIQKGKSSDTARFDRKDGTSFWGNILISKIPSTYQKSLGFSVILRDLTQQKNAESGFIQLFNASPSGMIIASTENGQLIKVNDSFLNTFGYTREEAIGFTADQLGFVSTETQLEYFGKLKEQGYLKNEEIPAQTKAGKKIYTLFSVELFEMDGKPYFLCIFHDITEIKEIGIRLTESEYKYRKLIEEAGDVLYTTDAYGYFTYINQRVTTLTEYKSNELIGKHFSILIAPEWQEKVRITYLEQFQNRLPETIMEFPIHTKTGKEKWVEQIVIMQSTPDLIMGFQCIVHDITERKNASLLLAEQKKITEQKNKNILDSINYAKRIQDAIFPPEELIKELLPNSFVLFKPKDVIGGDFYWLEKFSNKTFIAAVDCTGHGVPGALLSIIGYNLLSKSINERGRIAPNEILNELSYGIHKTLQKTSENSAVRDTMDIALCSIDWQTNMLEFSGAHNSLYIFRNDELIEIPADRFPVGVILNGELRKFTNHQIKLEKGDTIYLFSDGYADQFGGPLGKKIKYNTFKKILHSIQQLSMEEQKNALISFFDEWKQEKEEQTDDVLIVGINV